MSTYNKLQASSKTCLSIASRMGGRGSVGGGLDIGHHPTDMQATRDFASVNSVQSLDFTII
ncbi:hypothetical protein CH063_07120 [Colletotrichum higginsianum]|uniref:Uncharacterized protein n=1 Tax=Colletotrichum higginsianum (strain IMI 349063) TaxID=759273 RepID=H1V505_COLHI|nr:hypothetical protein CH063_07120 [Colletotrichum higginsianum]